jgi:transposase
MPIVGGLDIHRKQLTFDYLDTVTGEVKRGQIAPADRVHLRAWLARFAGRDDVAFALEGCTGWRYVAEELAGAGVAAHVAEPADTAFARGRKRHAKTDKTDSRHLRELLAEGRLPECWVPPSHILECRALLETYHDLRAEHTAWVQRIHAVFFHQGWLAGEGRFSSSRKAVRFAGLDVTVWSSDRKGPPGRLSRQGPPVLRWAVYEAGKTHARASAPDHRYYAAVKDRKDGKRAAISEARKRSMRTVGCFTDGHGRAALAACSGCTRAAVPGRGTSAIAMMACRPRERRA